MSDQEPIPQAVALAAQRYAALQLFQLRGRAHAMSFFDDCIATAEMCQDIMNEMGEEYTSSQRCLAHNNPCYVSATIDYKTIRNNFA